MPAQIVAITGSGSGIGRATARRFLAAGATVYGFDIIDQAPEPDGAGRWVPRRLDVSDAEAVRREMAAVTAEHGAVDVLVTSAAVGFPENFTDMPVESWDRVWDINVTGTMVCVRSVLPSMIERGGGAVVVISSIAGRSRSVANGAHYTVSKYGLIGLTRHVAAELAGTGVRINCVAPGPTDSPILTANSTEDQVQKIIESTPLRRIAEPDDVAGVVTFAASERARQIHGAVLDVNGGLY
ncbi:SDR family NAD(P)-dependent oxidoreductase [Georgenia deserti]|uniref:SDR family NAD(P)-dependent oxidoreductase n=1 Tax=Georgenia deserti TaxID=2093781 RepID=A0ABW4L4N9_9MICO